MLSLALKALQAHLIVVAWQEDESAEQDLNGSPVLDPELHLQLILLGSGQVGANYQLTPEESMILQQVWSRFPTS